MSIIGGIIQGVVGAGTAIGNAVQGRRAQKRQQRNQLELMDVQQRNQMELNQQGKDLAYQQWLDTNYSAQKDELQKAGMNAGLLYGMSGGGGVTANTGSGGSASGGQAQQQQLMDMSGIQNLATQIAQVDLIKAQTEKTKVETAKTAGVDTENTKADTAGRLTQNEINKLSKEAQIEYWKAQATEKVATGEQAIVQSNIMKNTEKAQIQEINDRAKLPAKQAEEIDARITNMLELARQGREKINIEKFAKELIAEYPSITSVMGKGANELTMWLQKQLAKVIGEENASNYRKVK